MSNLLHPELITSIPVTGKSFARRMQQQATELERAYDIKPWDEPDVTVAVRTLNDADRLKSLLIDIDKQKFSGIVDVVVVDNESTDDTPRLAMDMGARLITLERSKVTHPRSMNEAMDSANTDLVFLTVGHAALSTDMALRSGTRHFQNNMTAGVFAHSLPNDNSSATQLAIAMGNRPRINHSNAVEKAGPSVMASQNAIWSKPLWDSNGWFDEKLENGGVETELAAKLIDIGYEIIEDPLVAAHYSSGRGLANTVRQWRAWGDVANSQTK